MNSIKIACPKCEWEPEEKSRWMCTCKHVWNTFDTGGRCPACKKVWEDTMCLSCNKWSPHLDWYKGLDDVVSELTAEMTENIRMPMSDGIW